MHGPVNWYVSAVLTMHSLKHGLPSEIDQVNRWWSSFSLLSLVTQFSLEATHRFVLPLVCCLYKKCASGHHAEAKRVWGGGRASCVTSKTPKAQQ